MLLVLARIGDPAESRQESIVFIFLSVIENISLTTLARRPRGSPAPPFDSPWDLQNRNSANTFVSVLALWYPTETRTPIPSM